MKKTVTSSHSAAFVSGSLMRHVVVMTSNASIGLFAMFLVDFVDLYFISLLGEQALAAAVGYSGTLQFFVSSMSLGFSIACSALVAQHLGAERDCAAKSVVVSVLMLGLAITPMATVIAWLWGADLLAMLGASGTTLVYATEYLRIASFNFPIMMIIMVLSAVLRAHGLARQAMYTTLTAATANAVLDPIFIFGLGLGLKGAAYASVCGFTIAMCVAVYLTRPYLGTFADIKWRDSMRSTRSVLAIALPAILTNVSTPVGNFFMTISLSKYGDLAVAAYSVIGRLIPLAFCAIFAISGAVGPIVGQNFGAKRFDRIRETLLASLKVITVYMLVVWAILLLLKSHLIHQFGLIGVGEALLTTFVWIVTPLFLFNGVLFSTNAAFNNLNRPLWSTALNWLKNTVFLWPFAWLGELWMQAEGVLIGQAIGSMLMGCIGLWLALQLTQRCSIGQVDCGTPKAGIWTRIRPLLPFSTPRW